jgi:hypothetical protein
MLIPNSIKWFLVIHHFPTMHFALRMTWLLHKNIKQGTTVINWLRSLNLGTKPAYVHILLPTAKLTDGVHHQLLMISVALPSASSMWKDLCSIHPSLCYTLQLYPMQLCTLLLLSKFLGCLLNAWAMYKVPTVDLKH